MHIAKINLLLVLCGSFSLLSADDSLQSAVQDLAQTLDNVQKILQQELPKKTVAITKIDATEYAVGIKRILLIKGDITKQKNIEVLVNAANRGNIATVIGGGVAGAISRAMPGEDIPFFKKNIEERYKTLRGETGKAYIGQLRPDSQLFKLGYKYLVSAVGPNCGAGEEVNLVANAYLTSLQEAAKVGATSIVFPRISALIFGCPAHIINPMAVNTVIDYLENNQQSTITHVYFIFYPGTPQDDEALKEYKKLLDQKAAE